jgi:hypothetical protein
VGRGTIRRWSVTAALVAVAAAAAAPSAAAGSRADAADCPPVTPTFEVTPATSFDAGWAAYGNDNTLTDDWTGADGAYSIRLPDGRSVWSFSDTFLGTVNPDGSRPNGTPLINNDLVVQQGNALVATLHGGTAARPTSLAVPTDASWYWTLDGTVEGDHLRLLMAKYQRTGPGMWDWHWSGTDVVSYSLPDLQPEGTAPAPSENGVTYGSGILERPGATYVYGTEDHGAVKYLHVARVRDGLLGQWEFWTGSAWSSDPLTSARLTSGVDNGFSVTKVGNRFLLVTLDTSVIFGNQLVAYTACSATGPWSGPLPLYATPEKGPDLFVYNAQIHPEFTRSGWLLLTYDVNSFVPHATWDDVTIYRPRFLRVRIVP